MKHFPRAIIAFALLLWGGGVACAKPVLLHPATGSVTVSSATINSDGDELTVALSGAATISDATGWTVEFDNGASRTIAYSSGSGSDTFVFEFAAVSPSTDGRAPVGTVCTVDYDADAGNVAGLADVTDQSVTNNSTQIPDPDLPQGLPDPSLPSNVNDAADHTPADMAALNELCDEDGVGDAAAGDVIALSGTYTGQLVIKPGFGDASGLPIIFKGADYGDLPSYGTRVDATHQSSMAVLERTPSSSGHSTIEIQGNSDNFRFIGVCFKSTGTYANTNFLGPVLFLTSGVVTPVADLPSKVGFDRCIVTCDSGITPKDVMRLDATDSFVVGCHFYNLAGGGEDGSNAMRLYRADNCLIDNNFMECMGACVFLGDNGTNHVSDVKISNIYHSRPTAWNDGLHGDHKANIELKVGERILMENLVLDGHFNAAFGAITCKVEGAAAAGPKNTTHVTMRGVKIKNATEGLNLWADGSGDDDDDGPSHDILVEDVLVEDGPSKSIDMRVWDSTGSAGYERVQIRNCTLFGTVDIDSTASGVNHGDYHLFRDNILSGTYGYNVNTGGEGCVAFNWAWSSNYTATHNLIVGKSASAYDSDASPAPLGTLSGNIFSAANNTAVGFNDFAGGDYSLGAGSSYLTSSSTGGRLGYDSTTYDAIWEALAP